MLAIFLSSRTLRRFSCRFFKSSVLIFKKCSLLKFFLPLSLSYTNVSSFHEFSQILTGGVGRLPNYFEESTDFHGTGGSRSNINAPGGICVMSWYREPAADGRKCHGGWAPGAPQRIQKHSEAPADPAKRTTHHAERMTGAQMRFFQRTANGLKLTP